MIAGPGLLAARPVRADDLIFKGWRLDLSAMKRPLTADEIASLQAQIDILEHIEIKPQIRTFFHSVPCQVQEHVEGTGDYQSSGKLMVLTAEPQSPNNPVLLHELAHAYHDQMLPLGFQNLDVQRFFRLARVRGDFPAGSYMYANPGEFFAMCVSVRLWGVAARPPSTRELLRAKLPEFYAWIGEAFQGRG